MNLSWPCEIEVLFGSKNRADYDALSDVDYLIADDNAVRLSERKKALEAFGFSVSDYTLRRLRALFCKRTLFATHLKLEGRVIFDQKAEFRGLAEGLDPYRDYKVEQTEAIRLFAPLEIVPDNPVGFMWALDHLAVAFRNAAIIDHARRGEFVFAYDELLSNYQLWGEASVDDLHALRLLRKAKRRYRDGVRISDARQAFERGLRAVNNLLCLDMSSEFRTRVCFAQLGHTSNSTDAYVALRAIEREIVSYRGNQSLSANAESAQGLMRTVRNPHGYLWRLMYAPADVAESLDELRAVCL